jgi:hypothetical protein
MDVATRLAPCEDDPAILCDNFDSVVRESPRANLANQNVALSIGSTHKIFLPMGAILTPIVYLTMQSLLQTRVDFPGHDVAISETVFCLPVLASIAESTLNRTVLRIALRLTSRISLRVRWYAPI